MQMQAKACFLMSNPYLDSNGESQAIGDDTHGSSGLLYYISTVFFTFIHILMIIPSTVLVHMLDLFALLITIGCWHAVAQFVKDQNRDNSMEEGGNDEEKALKVTTVFDVIRKRPISVK
jgi:hypothetical protein